MASPSPTVPASAPTPDADSSRPLWPFLVALSCVAGLAELAFIIVNVSALPVYLKNGLGLPSLPGLALACFYLAEALGNSPMGVLSDRVGRRRLMVTGACVSVATCLITAFIRPPREGGPGEWLAVAALLGLRLADGLGAAMLWPAVFATVGDRVAASKQAQAMSALNITYLIGIAFGPFVGGWVNDTFGVRYPESDPRRYVPSFLVAAGCFAATAVIAFFVAPSRSRVAYTPTDAAPEIAAAQGVAKTIADKGGASPLAALQKAIREVPTLLVLGFLIFFGVGLIAPYVKPYFMARFDLTESEFGTLLLWPALIIAAVSLPIGKLADVWGKSRAIHVGMGVCAVALWIILFLKHQWSMVLVGSLLGVGFILAFPAYMAYLAELTGPEERAGMIGAVRMAQGVGALLGAALASPLYALDPAHHSLFISASTLVTIGFALSLLYVKPQPTDKTPSVAAH